MGRNRTPTELLDAKGSFLKHPEYKRKSEPKIDSPLGGPPKHLTPEQAKVWRELAKCLIRGVGKYSDRPAFESLVLLNARERDSTVTGQERGQLISLYSRFALIPADRNDRLP